MTTTKSKALEKSEIAALMGCKQSSAISRLVALGYTEVCGRCGGSGRYSWNQIDGDRCFGCGGSGKKLARITAEVVAAALARIEAGELAGYFAENKARKEIKAAVAKTQATWRAASICAAYNAACDAQMKTARERAMAGHEDLYPNGSVTEQPVGRAQTLINDLMQRAWDQESPFRRAATALERLAIVQQAEAMILAVDAAFQARQ